MFRNDVDAASMNEKDIEKEADMGRVKATTSTGGSSAPTVCSPQKVSDCQFGWRDISYTVDNKKDKKQILQNVSGCVEKGTFLSIPTAICICTLLTCREFAGDYGAFRVWQDNSPQHPLETINWQRRHGRSNACRKII